MMFKARLQRRIVKCPQLCFSLQTPQCQHRRTFMKGAESNRGTCSKSPKPSTADFLVTQEVPWEGRAIWWPKKDEYLIRQVILIFWLIVVDRWDGHLKNAVTWLSSAEQNPWIERTLAHVTLMLSATPSDLSSANTALSINASGPLWQVLGNP